MLKLIGILIIIWEEIHMECKEELQEKLRRKNQILFSKDSAVLEELNMLLGEQNHRVTALWAFDLAEEAVSSLEERYPEEQRPRRALEACRMWAAGAVKMPEAKREILACHAVAKELSSPEDIALCHAVGQACSVVHTVGHAPGFPVYDLTAVVRRYGFPDCMEHIEKRVRHYIDRLLYWRENYNSSPRKWADFMLKD